LFVLLHEMELHQIPEQQAQLHASLPRLMQDAAAALQEQHEAAATDGSSGSELQQQQQLEQQHVSGQLADMLFAIAVHALDCEAAAAAAVSSYDGNNSSSSGSLAWYLDTSCVALVDAAAGCINSWRCDNMARGVSASTLSGVACLYHRCLLLDRCC
jgi:hypothetical protein